MKSCTRVSFKDAKYAPWSNVSDLQSRAHIVCQVWFRVNQVIEVAIVDPKNGFSLK